MLPLSRTRNLIPDVCPLQVGNLYLSPVLGCWEVMAWGVCKGTPLPSLVYLSREPDKDLKELDMVYPSMFLQAVSVARLAVPLL